MGWWKTGQGDDVCGDAPLDDVDRAHALLASRALPAWLRLWQDALNAVALRRLSDPGGAPFRLRARLVAGPGASSGTGMAAEIEADAAAPGAADLALAVHTLEQVAKSYGDAVERWPRSSEVISALEGSLALAIDSGRVPGTHASLDTLRAEPGASAAGQALVAIEVLRAQLEPLLWELGQEHDGRLADTLRPRAGDAALAFIPEAAVAAEAAYDALWRRSPARVGAVPMSHTLQIDLAPAGMLGDDNVLSRAFPGGYRGVAARLDPRRVWVRWTYAPSTGAPGLAYDGLVWLDDHWVWYPKPYRVLAG